VKAIGIKAGDRRVPPPAQPNLSLAHGLECLDTLVRLGRPAGSRELARQLDMEHTRVNRLLGTLAHLGLVEKTADRQYAPGSGLHVLAAMSLRGSRLLACALPHLRDLMAREKGCRIALGVLWRSHVCYLFFGIPGRPVEEGIANTAPYDAERSSIGQVLLAARTQADVRALYRQRRTGRLGGRELDALLARLAGVRACGYAVVVQQSTSVGVGVGQPPFAGLAAAGEFDRKRIPALVKDLQAAARAIAEGMVKGNSKLET
jgi:DNA-binding IclR family transcriptional regulator